MPYTHDSADVHIARMAETNIVDAEAIGGNRRRRAALISAAMRREYPGAVRLHVSYSETYGFQTATYARYRVAVESARATVDRIVRHTGVAGQTSYTVTVTYPGEGPMDTTFVGSVYGSPGPVVMVGPSGHQTFVRDPERFGTEFGEPWVRAFATSA